MRFASRFFLVSSLLAAPVALVAACTSFPDLVDTGGAGDASLDSAGPPTIVVVEADGNIVTTLLDGAPVPDAGPTMTGGDDDSGMTTGGDDSGPQPVQDSGGPVVDAAMPDSASPVTVCHGASVDCAQPSSAHCLGCNVCSGQGCSTCNGANPLAPCKQAVTGFSELCCSKNGVAQCGGVTSCN